MEIAHFTCGKILLHLPLRLSVTNTHMYRAWIGRKLAHRAVWFNKVLLKENNALTLMLDKTNECGHWNQPTCHHIMTSHANSVQRVSPQLASSGIGDPRACGSSSVKLCYVSFGCTLVLDCCTTCNIFTEFKPFCDLNTGDCDVHLPLLQSQNPNLRTFR